MTSTSFSKLVSLLSNIADLKQEHFLCLSFDSAQKLIANRTVFIGTLDSVMAHPREVYADPLMDRAAAIVVAHNHPSGDVRPSQQDIKMTQQLIAAGQILGVPLNDHIIIGGKKHFSFRGNGLL